MRNLIAGLILLVAAVLGYCTYISAHSKQHIAKKLTNFMISLYPPIAGNLIIIIAKSETFALFGRYLYAIGIDITMHCLLDFAMEYCGFKWQKFWQRLLISCIVLDIIQLLCNPFFHHAFETDMMMVYGAPYYNVKSYFGRNIHLALVYAIMATVLAVLIIKMKRSAIIYVERYSIITLLLLFTGLWEIFYLLSRTPVKSSVIAYGIFGILVFYFSLYYRPRRLLDSLLADIASGLTDGLFFFDDSSRCLWADENGLNLIEAKESDHRDYAEAINLKFPGLNIENSEWEVHRKLADRYYKLSKHTVFDNRKKVLGSVLSVMDESENELKIQKERYIANHDPLTGLFTKKHLYEITRQRIDSEPDKTFYICYMDIKNFKMINDVFGDDFGDYTLKSIADNIISNMPEKAVYGRIGSDTFGMCLSQNEFNPELAEKFISQFRVEKDGATYNITMHEGVYKVVDRSVDVSIMYDRAHMAMDTIKNDHRKFLAIYDDKIREKVLWDQSISMQLEDALKNNDIRPYLQPIVDTKGKVIGAEALVRWKHPEKGLLPPISFISTFENNGMITDVDRHMWRCSAQILKRWERLGRNDLFISINVSPKDFFFFDVFEELRKIVKEYEIKSSCLRIEITESSIINDKNYVMDALKKLRNEGFIVEMDDFGSGYSSLNMLKDMPVDVIKVDMKFIDDTNDLDRSSIILHNLFNMMSELGVISLMEGVEKNEQYTSLTRMGCKLFQGYLFSKPIPVDEFEKEFQINTK